MWCPWVLQDINKLEKTQRDAAQFVVSDYSCYASVSEMTDVLRWLI